jgi:multiple sugar transport system substrate-binding protein
MGSAVGGVESGQFSPDVAIAQIRSKLSVLAKTAPPV